MLIEERRKAILTLLNGGESLSVKTLSEQLQVSEMTIQRDIKALEGMGVLRRVRGGAARSSRADLPEPQFDARRTLNRRLKESLARYAARELVEDDEIIVLEGGTTVASMAPFLERKNLIVLTNGFKTMAQALPYLPRLNLMSCGGMLRDTSYTLVGPQAEAFFASFHAHKFFLSGSGLTLEEGLTDPNPMEIEIKRAMRRCARQVILLIDSSKFGQQSLCPILPLEEIDILVTDSGAPQPMLAELRKMGIDVRVVSEP